MVTVKVHVSQKVRIDQRSERHALTESYVLEPGKEAEFLMVTGDILEVKEAHHGPV